MLSAWDCRPLDLSLSLSLKSVPALRSVLAFDFPPPCVEGNHLEMYSDTEIQWHLIKL